MSVAEMPSSSVGVAVDAVASSRPSQPEAVLMQRFDELAGRDATRDIGHRLTATAGVGHSTAPRSGSTGIGSPDSRSLAI